MFSKLIKAGISGGKSSINRHQNSFRVNWQQQGIEVHIYEKAAASLQGGHIFQSLPGGQERGLYQVEAYPKSHPLLSVHYYIEGQRIVSKLGGGMDEQGSAQAGNGYVGFAKKHQDLIDGIVRNLKFLGEDGSILTAGKSGKVPPGQTCPDEGGIWRRHWR